MHRKLLKIFQDAVGEDHEWDVVFVDHDPVEERTRSVSRLLASSRLVIMHDTESWVVRGNPLRYPADFM